MLGTLTRSGFFTYQVCRKLDPSLPLHGMWEEGGDRRGGEGGEGRGGEGRGEEGTGGEEGGEGTIMSREDV